MNDQECRELYLRLSRFLSSDGIGLSWVTELAREEIRAGKVIRDSPEYRRLSTDQSRDQDEFFPVESLRIAAPGDTLPSSSSRQTNANNINLTFQAYSEREKLIILIELIRKAVAGTTLMEVEILQLLEDQENFGFGYREIIFVDDSEDVMTHRINFENISEKANRANELVRLLDDLQDEVNS